MAKPQYVVVVGSLDMGYSIHGPFPTEFEAQDWLEEQEIVEHSTYIMDLIDKRDGYYSYEE